MQVLNGRQCTKCNNVKTEQEFSYDKRTGGLYTVCLLCYKTATKQFWIGKHYKICRACDRKLNLRNFAHDVDGIPYTLCSECYDTRVNDLYQEKRAAQRDNGAERVKENSARDAAIGPGIPSLVAG